MLAECGDIMSTERQRVSTGNPWETSVCFSRAVRVGNTIYTAGTLAADAAGKIHGADAYEQCCYIFEKLGAVLDDLGSGLSDTVKVLCYLTGLEHADGFTRAHAKYFADTLPATTCVCVAALFGEGSVAEIELVAVVGSP